MRLQAALLWTFGAHLLAIGCALIIPPKKAAPSPKVMRSVSVHLKNPPPPKKAALPKTAAKRGKRKSSPVKKRAEPKRASPPKTSTVKPAPPQFVPIDYQQLLVERLKEQLELPEIGSVEIKITFGKRGGDKEGVIERIDVIASQSAANSRYLVSAIKKIELPPLPRNLRGSYEPLIIEFSSAGS